MQTSLLHGETPNDPATMASSSSVCKQLRKRLTWEFSLSISLPMLSLMAHTGVAWSCRLFSDQSCTQPPPPDFQRKPFVADPYQIIAELLPSIFTHTVQNRRAAFGSEEVMLSRSGLFKLENSDREVLCECNQKYPTRHETQNRRNSFPD